MDFKDLIVMEPIQRIQYLMSIGLLIPERDCPKCKRKLQLKKRTNYSDGASWRCMNCKSFYTVRTGSFFEKLRLPILDLLEVIEYWAKERKLVDMEESLKISKPTLIKVCQTLRQLCSIDLDIDNFKIGGENTVVEIDESVFNKVKYNKGKDLVHYKKEKQLWVFGMKSRADNKVLFQVIIFFI